ncbi:siderophore-interacting protein [Comamonas sp. J-3]|uniref:siderophore-interacting protein n=1 Tax=Comamonas trifloxystrobinivorans TaxID=3350256 RepID=UPI00372868ED
MPLQLSLPTPASADLLAARTPQRARHDIKLRVTTVQSATRITPHMVRVVVHSPDLAGFTSLGFDDHMKLLFPDASGQLQLPAPGSEGLPPELREKMRDYTPTQYDAQANTLTIDFAVHEAGPATAWALQAAPGQPLGIAGPRGSFIIPTAFDGHLLIGDDASLPAIARRLAELPAGTRAIALVEVESAADEQALSSATDAQIHWVHRNGRAAGEAEGLLQALAQLDAPAGDYYCWVALEASAAKALRAALVTQYAAHPKWTKAAAYWKRGSVGVHEVIEE